MNDTILAILLLLVGIASLLWHTAFIAPQLRKIRRAPLPPIPRGYQRHIKLRENGGHHTEREWLALCAKYKYRCLACGQKRPLSKDHVVPVYFGGSDAIDNIQPLCKSCNSSKGTRHIDYR